jgi:spermidine/putrescine transport system substrate-binding protein
MTYAEIKHSFSKKIIITAIAFFLVSNAEAVSEILNIYIWNAYLPTSVIKQFTKETGIKVNVSQYDSNEAMYAKLKASPQVGYDLILPSNYIIERMKRQNMLHEIDKQKLPNFKYINHTFLNKSYDPQNQYSIPYLLSITGILVNTDYVDANKIKSWQDLWQDRFHNQLLILDDMRDVFAMAFLTLGYPVNDTNQEHIKEAYLKLKKLMPNVKIFNSDVEQSIYIDEDATIGMAWNGDANMSKKENPKLEFIYPKEGFVIAIDCLAIPKAGKNLENAYKFINFLLRPDIASKVSLKIGYPTTILKANKLLPKEMQKNPLINPPEEILRLGQIQTDIDEVLPTYEKYWELLKIND